MSDVTRILSAIELGVFDRAASLRRFALRAWPREKVRGSQEESNMVHHWGNDMTRPLFSLRRRRATAVRRVSRPCLLLETLENRICPTVLNLTMAGASGTINGAILSQFTQQPAGSGTFNSFVRLSTNQSVEQGYNTNFRPLQFDENSSSSFTHAIQLRSVPIVIASNGSAYYEFVLDVNQVSSSPLLSLDELRFYATDSSTVDPTLLHNYDSTAHTLQDDGGRLYTPRYDLNPSGDVNYVILNATLSSGSGAGDMTALVPVALLGSDRSQYVYLYSEFGIHNANNGGFEQWATSPAPAGTISGTIFEDKTGDGFTSDDTVLGGSNPDFVPVTVQLFQNSTLVATTTSDTSGTYQFSSLASGTYTISEVPPNGWVQTAAQSTTVTLTNGTGSSGNDFDNFLVAALQSGNTVLSVRALPAVPGSLQVATGTSSTSTVRLNGLVVGTFVAPNLQSVSVQSAANYTVDTSLVTSVPVAIHDTPGNDTYDGGASGTTVFLNSGSTAGTQVTGGVSPMQKVIQLTGGINTLNFSPTSFGVSFNAGMQQGQFQSLDSLGEHQLSVTGIFQNIVGTSFNDTLTAALPTFTPGMSTVGMGTTIMSGLGQDTVFGTLGTKAQEDGSGSQYIQVVSPAAVSELLSAIGEFGASPNALGGFASTVLANGGSSSVSASLLTTASFSGTQNSFTQSLDANSAQVVQAALASFGNSAGSLGGFGGSVGVTGGFNSIQVSTLTNVTLAGGTNTFTQSLDPNAAQVLNQTISSFGNSAGSVGGFGNAVGSLGGFGGSVGVTGGFNEVETSLLTSVSMSAGTNTYVQSIDANAAGVLKNAIQTIAQSFGNALGNAGGFGNILNELGGFGNSLNATGGFNTIFTSILTNTSVNGGSTQYDQSLDANAVGVLNQAVASFGNSLTTPGGFGNALNTPGGFGNSLNAAGGFNTVVTSVLTAVTVGGGNNTFAQALDANAAGFLEGIIAGFGNSTGAIGGFGNTVNDLGGFGNSLSTPGGFNTVFASILTTVNLGGGNNSYTQSLDQNSEAVLAEAINAFGSSVGQAGGFGNALNTPGGFGNSLTTPGGFNTVYLSLLTAVNTGGGHNTIYQSLDADSVAILNQAVSVITSFGGAVGDVGGFGNSVASTGGYSNAQASLLTTVQLSGGFDTTVEHLSPNAVAMADAALADAAGGGPAAINAAASALGLHAILGDGSDVVVGGLLGRFQAGNGGDRIVIEDPTLLGATTLTDRLLQYGGSFTAGTGPNTFFLVGATFGHVQISEPGTNSDTLDLSSVYTAGPTIDLSTSAEQQVLPGKLWLTLTSPGGFAAVAGNGTFATLKAGSRGVTLMGAAPLDPRAANPPAWHGQTQLVFIDFNTFTTGTKHVYTAAEQQGILARLQAVYADFDVQFTLQQPASQPYATLFINKTPVINGQSEEGGLADEIDFRNLNLSTTAAIDINGFLGGPGEPAATSANFVAITATVAAHELGHTLGLLHSDSFGPIGFGIHDPPGVTTYLPVYPGFQAAWETTQDIMASPASVGSTLFDAAGNTTFGVRDDIKLAFIEGGTVVNEQAGAHASIATAQALTLVGLQVPNTESSGFDANKVLSVAAVDVANASLQLDTSTGQTQNDFYAFQGQAGDLINIQAMSFSLTRITDPVDTMIHVFDASGNLVAYYTGQAVSDDNFETADATITDLTLPKTGTYYIQVSPFSNTETGHYELFIYRFQAGNAIPAGGSHDTYIVGPGQDILIGRGGQDTVQDSGAANYTLTNGQLTGTGTATLQNITNAMLIGAAGGTTFNVSGWTGTATLIGAGGVNTVVLSRDANFTLSNGLLTVSNGGTFQLVNIQNVVLTGGPSNNTFDVSGWTGTATLTGGGGSDTVALSRAANFVLKDGLLTVSSGGTFTLVNINNAVLTGGPSGSVFDMRGWTGTSTLNSLGGSNPVMNPRGVAVSTLEQPSAPLGVAGFTDLGTTAATYTAVVNWGDGSMGTGGGSANGQVVTILSAPAYKEEGTYTVTTTLSQGPLFSVIVNSTATVGDAPLTASPALVNPGMAILNAPIATFVDANPAGLISDFTAQINWGDGSTSAGQVTQPKGIGTSFVIGGTHVYGVTSSRTITVTIQDDGGQSASTTFTITISPSLLALDPTASGALTISGGAAITIPGIIVVDSNSTSAISASGNSQLTGSAIDVVGNVSNSNGATISPTPITGIAPVSDPLAGLPLPSSNVNGGSVNVSKGTTTLNPGIYSQIKASGTGTKLILNPGIYIIAGGGLTISSSASISGTSVMICNAGSKFPTLGGSFGGITLTGSGSFSLTAPTSGTYAGILIFQERDNTATLSLSANAGLGLSGVIYAPAALLAESGSGKFQGAVIVDQVKFTGGSGASSPTTLGTSAITSPTAGTSNTTAVPTSVQPSTAGPVPLTSSDLMSYQLALLGAVGRQAELKTDSGLTDQSQPTLLTAGNHGGITSAEVDLLFAETDWLDLTLGAALTKFFD